MRRTAAQRAAITQRARRWAKRHIRYTQYHVGKPAPVTLARIAYEAGFKAGEGKAVAAPAAALLHVLDTQAELKATIARLREKMRGVSADLLWEAGK